MNYIEDIIEIVIDSYDIENLLNTKTIKIFKSSSDYESDFDSYSMKLSLMEGGLLSSRDIIQNKKRLKISNLRNLFYFSNNV